VRHPHSPSLCIAISFLSANPTVPQIFFHQNIAPTRAALLDEPNFNAKNDVGATMACNQSEEETSGFVKPTIALKQQL
jgi:hypothetical protein